MSHAKTDKTGVLRDGTAWEILPGLPGQGPLPLRFAPEVELGSSEGLVLRVVQSSGGDWVANFRPGTTGFSTVHQWPEGSRLLVVAGGQGYLVDVGQRCVIQNVGRFVEAALGVDTPAIVLLSELGRVKAIGLDGLLWESKRLCDEGLTIVASSSSTVLVECPGHRPPVRLDLGTGKRKRWWQR